MLYAFHPELGQAAPVDAQIHARLSYGGRHYFLRTAPGLTLKGRGVTFTGVSTAESLVPGSKFVGWGEYTVTTAAFKKIASAPETKVCTEILLD